jgi:DNA polymerase-3 subunit gamma/tau
MGYQVIARKYRPQRFDDVVGQDHVTQTLANAIRQNRIAHAYLFCGPRGTGKTTIARIFAKCLNCTDGPRVDFDDEDPRCHEIAEGRSLDVIEIDGASNRGVDEIRELRETVRYTPATARFKVYIIDEVHMLTKEAFNALLKTLEEPPEHVKFMFATTEPEKVLPTILSRCQRFDLRRIPAALIVKHLQHISELEQVQISEAALFAIARGADGGMRDAESTLDQLISFCGNQIEESDVLSMFGLAAQAQVLDLARAVLAGAPEDGLRLLDDLVRHGKDLARLVTDLLRHFRNLMILRVTPDHPAIGELSEAERSSLAEHADAVSTEAIGRILDVLIECEARLRNTPSKRILVEITLFRSIEARHAVSLDSILKTLHQLRSEDVGAVATRAQAKPRTSVAARGTKSASSRPLAKDSRAAATAQVQSAQASSAKPELAKIWSEVLEAVGRVSPFVKTYLLAARPVGLAKNVLTIGFDPEFADQLELADTSNNRILIQTKLKELGKGTCQVKFVKAEGPPPGPPPEQEPTASAAAESRSSRNAAPVRLPSTPSSSSSPPPEVTSIKEEDFKNDPLIRKALEIFRGQIVEVRST